MYEDVRRLIQGCRRCNLIKNAVPVKNGRLQPTTALYPFHTVGVDLIGLFKRTTRGHQYALVIIDYFTNWVEAAPLKTQLSEEMADVFFKELILRHGCPTQVVAYNGTNSASGLFEKFCKRL